LTIRMTWWERQKIGPCVRVNRWWYKIHTVIAYFTSNKIFFIQVSIL
jgi:hypothetical protein